jgi:hypothetical protein
MKIPMSKREKLINSLMETKFRDDDPKNDYHNRQYLQGKSIEELEDMVWEWKHLYDYHRE